MPDYYKSVKIPIRLIGYPKRKGKSGLLRKRLRTAACLVSLFSVIVIQTGIFSAYEAHIINVTAHICNYSETRTIGYWKTHPSVYLPLLPQTLGGINDEDQLIENQTEVNEVFNADNSIMRNKLRKQLLAMKFNIAYFGIGEYLVEGENKTLNQIVMEADDLLGEDPPPSNSVLEEMKDFLDYLNNLHKIRFCAVVLPPPDECELQLTKTASADEVTRGETITYHLTLDNVGGKVCTGGGVLLKDMFDKSLLQYLDYTSTRRPKSFSKGGDYVQWNFGNIYPEDPLIEIDLAMKVSHNAQCDSTITNTAKYWSNQTDWGDPVTVDIEVVCESAPETGVVINEFLPNPKGNDRAKKPKGEWVELYNKGTSTVDVAGWMLYDEKDSNELPISSDNTNTGSTLIDSGGFLVVYRNGDRDFALDNRGGDTVRLYDGEIKDGANLIDSHTYTIDALENKSFARIPDGSDNWVDPVPTPGEPNLIEDEEVVFGEAIPEEGEEGYEGVENENEIENEISLLGGSEIIEDGGDVPEEQTNTTEEIIASPESTSTIEEMATTTEKIATSSEETATSVEDISIDGNENDLSSNGNEPDSGIIEEIDETIGMLVEGIVKEIMSDESVLSEPTENPAEIQRIEEQVIEEVPVEETVAIEQAPAIEEQPAIIPENNAISDSGSGGDGTSNGGDEAGSGDGGTSG